MESKKPISLVIIAIACILPGVLAFVAFGIHWCGINYESYLLSFGAITAPGVSLFAAIMFYRAISAQVESNIIQTGVQQLQETNQQIEMIIKFYDYLVLEVEKFEDTKFPHPFDFWILELADHNKTALPPGDGSAQYISILANIHYLCKKLDSDTLGYLEKEVFATKLMLLYNGKIRESTDYIISFKGKRHPEFIIFQDMVSSHNSMSFS
jgi:hypothetical protein